MAGARTSVAGINMNALFACVQLGKFLILAERVRLTYVLRYVLDTDGKTCLPTDVTCEITTQMESDYKSWLVEMEQWNNF